MITPLVVFGCETWSLTLINVHRLRVFESKMLRIFGFKREEAGKNFLMRGFIILCFTNIYTLIKSRRMSWADYVACMREVRNAYKILLGLGDWKKILGRSRRVWEYNISMDISDSSVGLALGYGLDDRCSKVRFPVGAGNFSLHHRVQNGSGAHPASYSMGSRGSFPGRKAPGA
jgi:hypothetical protein